MLAVFAYGATGAGKTYTMLGTAESPGVTFSAVMALFSKIDDNKGERIYDVSVSYLEVCNVSLCCVCLISGDIYGVCCIVSRVKDVFSLIGTRWLPPVRSCGQ